MDCHGFQPIFAVCTGGLGPASDPAPASPHIADGPSEPTAPPRAARSALRAAAEDGLNGQTREPHYCTTRRLNDFAGCS